MCYYPKDHLGNNIEVWYANTNSTVQRTQYYPSGLPWVEGTGASTQPYKYNGKEFIEMHGYDTYDYGARGYYPAIGRFTTVDPLAEKYYEVSPYAYVENNFVNKIDPDGRDGMFSGSGSKDDPYVISAAYFYQNGSLNDDDRKGLTDAASEYNNIGGKDGVKIKNEDGSSSYLKFNITVQGVDNLEDAFNKTSFESSDNHVHYYGNKIGTKSDEGNANGEEFGSATNHRVDINNINIEQGVNDYGYKKNDLIKGTYIHEIGHNLGGEHEDGTETMELNLTLNRDEHGFSDNAIKYPSLSKDFINIIFNRHDQISKNGEGRIWTK